MPNTIDIKGAILKKVNIMCDCERCSLVKSKDEVYDCLKYIICHPQNINGVYKDDVILIGSGEQKFLCTSLNNEHFDLYRFYTRESEHIRILLYDENHKIKQVALKDIFGCYPFKGSIYLTNLSLQPIIIYYQKILFIENHRQLVNNFDYLEYLED